MLTFLLFIVISLIVKILWDPVDSSIKLARALFLIIAFAAVYECQAHGAPFRILDVDRVNVSVAKFGCNRDPMTPQYDCHDYLGRVNSEFNLRLLDAGYWNNTVHTEGLEAQVKTVGWHFELGVHLLPYLDTFYEHHSRHVMEGEQPQFYDPTLETYRRGKFPVEDSYGVRLKFYINPSPAGSLLGK